MVAQHYRTVLLFGAPGAGKGTQGKMLDAIPGFFHFSTGDMFRNLDSDSELGKTFLSYSTKGELVPDALTVELWEQSIKDAIAANKYDPQRDILVLDGIPRSVAQTKLMDDHLDVLGIVLLDAKDRNEMIARLRNRALKENRPDDAKEDVIRRRLEVYAQETEPVLSHYPASLRHSVDAIGSPARVLDRVLGVVAAIQEQHFDNALG